MKCLRSKKRLNASDYTTTPCSRVAHGSRQEIPRSQRWSSTERELHRLADARPPPHPAGTWNSVAPHSVIAIYKSAEFSHVRGRLPISEGKGAGCKGPMFSKECVLYKIESL